MHLKVTFYEVIQHKNQYWVKGQNLGEIKKDSQIMKSETNQKGKEKQN